MAGTDYNFCIMTKRLFVILLAVSVLAGTCSVCTAKAKVEPLRDGFSLEGVDGKIVEDSNDWFFLPLEALIDDKGVIEAGARIKILPSSGLERLLLQKTDAGVESFRLWGTVTRYGDENFIFTADFLPITEVSETVVKLEEVKITGPNEPDIIPKDVMQMLRPKRVVNLAKLKKGIGTEQDGIVIDRTGFVKKKW